MADYPRRQRLPLPEVESVLMKSEVLSPFYQIAIISTPFCLHNCGKNFPICFRVRPYMTFLRYFGTNTT